MKYYKAAVWFRDEGCTTGSDRLQSTGSFSFPLAQAVAEARWAGSAFEVTHNFLQEPDVWTTTKPNLLSTVFEPVQQVYL